MRCNLLADLALFGKINSNVGDSPRQGQIAATFHIEFCLCVSYFIRVILSHFETAI